MTINNNKGVVVSTTMMAAVVVVATLFIFQAFSTTTTTTTTVFAFLTTGEEERDAVGGGGGAASHAAAAAAASRDNISISRHYDNEMVVVAAKVKVETNKNDNDNKASSSSAAPPKKMMTMELLSAHTVYNRRLLEEEEEKKKEEREVKRRKMKHDKDKEDRHFISPDSISPDNNNNNNKNKDEDKTQLQIDALYQGYGTHYVDLWVGTPHPQRQTVIVDTGSSVTSFPCEGCDNCGSSYHTDGYYNYTLSKTFHKLTCNECDRGMCKHSSSNNNKGSRYNYHNNKDEDDDDDEGYCYIHQGYAEGSSWTAFEAVDFLYAGGSHYESVDVQVNFPNTKNDYDEYDDEDDNNYYNKEKNIKDKKSTSRNNNNNNNNHNNNSEDEFFYSLSSNNKNVMKFEMPLKFGCQYSLTGLFRTQLADGIMGMSNGKYTFWYQMYEQSKISSKQFALCFSRSSHASKVGTNAGTMTMGGTNTKLHETPMVYAKANHGTFSLYIKRVYLRQGGGNSIKATTHDVHYQKLIPLDVNTHDLNIQGAIVDSGTTDTYFPSALSEPFHRVWYDLTGRRTLPGNGRHGEAMNEQQLKELPTIILQLKGVDNTDSFPYDEDLDPNSIPGLAGSKLDPNSPFDVMIAIPPSHYMYYDEKKGTYTPRIFMDYRKSVLGANTMQGHDVLFDVQHSRIGFAESHCDYNKLVQQEEQEEEGVHDHGNGDDYEVYDDDDHDDDDDDDDLFSMEKKNTKKKSAKKTFAAATAGSHDGDDGFCSSLACRSMFGVVFIALIIQFVIISKISNFNNSNSISSRDDTTTNRGELENLTSNVDGGGGNDDDDDDYDHDLGAQEKGYKDNEDDDDDDNNEKV